MTLRGVATSGCSEGRAAGAGRSGDSIVGAGRVTARWRYVCSEVRYTERQWRRCRGCECRLPLPCGPEGGFQIPAGAPGGQEDCALPEPRLDLCLPRSLMPLEGRLHCPIFLWEDPCLDLENGCRQSICQAQKTKLASPANGNLASAHVL